MSVFDGSIRTPRAVPDPFTDHLLPPPGALDYSSITTPTALAGTTGVDACLISGDKWQQLIGQHTENVTSNHLLMIQGNRQETVVGNHEHTIVGTTNTTHIGVHNHTNIAPRNDTFNHVRTENHAEQEHQNQPTGRNEHTNEEKTSTKKESHIKFLDWSITDFKFQAIGSNVEAKGIDISHKSYKAEMGEVWHNAVAASTLIGGVVTEVKAVGLIAAASHAKAVLFNGNAGVAANADSPLA